MSIGKRIKELRLKLNISQEELADKAYTTRQTISNWENDKTYPDINSLKLLSNIFDVSLDSLIEGDIDKMKRIIDESKVKEFQALSWIFTIEMIIMILSVYPLLKFLGSVGIIIWLFITIVTIATAFKVEKLKKEYNIQTYKEITAFYENKSMTHDEKISEKAKAPYQKVLLSIASAIIAILVFTLMKFILG